LLRAARFRYMTATRRTPMAIAKASSMARNLP
jgi:hypothetical protein